MSEQHTPSLPSGGEVGEIRAALAAVKPGPWGWYGSTSCDGRYYLATTYGGRYTVMSFRRSGTQSAQPQFQVDGRMVDASELVRFDVDPTVKGKTAAKSAPSVYRCDFSEIDHPVAKFIASAPQYVATLLAALTASEAERERLAADNVTLGRFAAKIMEEWPEGGSFELGDIQDIAAASGLLIETLMQQPCGEDSDTCACLEYCSHEEWPLQCYRVTDTLKRARECTP